MTINKIERTKKQKIRFNPERLARMYKDKLGEIQKAYEKGKSFRYIGDHVITDTVNGSNREYVASAICRHLIQQGVMTERPKNTFERLGEANVAFVLNQLKKGRTNIDIIASLKLKGIRGITQGNLNSMKRSFVKQGLIEYSRSINEDDFIKLVVETYRKNMGNPQGVVKSTIEELYKTLDDEKLKKKKLKKNTIIGIYNRYKNKY